MNRKLPIATAGLSVLLLAVDCDSNVEWLAAGDPIDPQTGSLYEIVPGAPRVTARATTALQDEPEESRREADRSDNSGPGKKRGGRKSRKKRSEEDDETEPRSSTANREQDREPAIEIGPEIGDIDLVIRSTAAGPARIPPPAAVRMQGGLPELIASRRTSGAGLPFTVFGSTGTLPLTPPPPGATFPDHPVLVLAFADLDGDGFVGITELDQDPSDTVLEERELNPVARRYAIADGSTASGELFVPIGGPPGAALEIALSAVTFAGPRDPNYYGGGVPMGPAIMTKLPFPPATAPAQVIGTRPTTAHVNALVGAEIEPLLTPDPSHPQLGEAFTMRLDGSQPSIDTAQVRSRDFVRFAFGDPVGAHTLDLNSHTPLRPGLAPSGERVVYQLPQHLTLPDDGEATRSTLHIVPIDDLGNITSLDRPHDIEISSTGPVVIVSPDRDGDPQRETLRADSPRGVEIVIDDRGGQWDDPNEATLELRGGFPPNQLPISLPDPDVDDSGRVDSDDIALIEEAIDLRLGDPDFRWALDLDGTGRIRKSDLKIADDAQGQRVPTP